MRVEPLSASAADTIRAMIEVGGYPGLMLLIFAENIFPPIPSELVLPLAGFYVGEGALAFLPAVTFATIGSLTGALVLYALGRRGGRPLVLRYGRVLRVTEERLDRAEAWTSRHGDAAVLFGRMIPGARSIVSIPAGMAKMGLARFTVLTTLGSVIWNSALIGAGWALGANWSAVTNAVGRFSSALLVVVVLAVGVGLVIWLVRRRRAARTAPTAAETHQQ